MRENIVKFGLELGATLHVYVATFCIFCNFLATFRILHSNFSHLTQQLFAFYAATFQEFTSTSVNAYTSFLHKLATNLSLTLICIAIFW